MGTSKGVFKTRSFRRVPENERWSANAIQTMTGVPWKTSNMEDSDKLKIKISEQQDLLDDREPGPIKGEDEAPKKFAINRKDLERYG